MNEVGATVVFIYTDYTYDIIKKKEEEEEEEDFFRVFLSFVVDHDILHTCPAFGSATSTTRFTSLSVFHHVLGF